MGRGRRAPPRASAPAGGRQPSGWNTDHRPVRAASSGLTARDSPGVPVTRHRLGTLLGSRGTARPATCRRRTPADHGSSDRWPGGLRTPGFAPGFELDDGILAGAPGSANGQVSRTDERGLVLLVRDREGHALTDGESSSERSVVPFAAGRGMPDEIVRRMRAPVSPADISGSGFRRAYCETAWFQVARRTASDWPDRFGRSDDGRPRACRARRCVPSGNGHCPPPPRRRAGCRASSSRPAG